MKKLVLTFKVVFLVLLGVLSVKMMYGDPVQKPIESLLAQRIDYAECPTDKYARPFFQVKGDDTKFHVIKEFTYRTGCSGKKESTIIGKSVSFSYFKDSPTSGKVVEVSINGSQIYSQSEFVGKSTSAGALLFMVVVAFSIWSFFGVKRHNNPL